eukprot:g38207.t1
MALGALLSALPEFLTHQYEYESGEIPWGLEGHDLCVGNVSASSQEQEAKIICRNRTSTNMMYLLLIGAQVLLGIGATPVQPLGVSYIDDHVQRKDSSLYIAYAFIPLLLTSSNLLFSKVFNEILGFTSIFQKGNFTDAVKGRTDE